MYDWADDAHTNHRLALLAAREIGVREGRFKPQSIEEARQAAEGCLPYGKLDCIAKYKAVG